MKHISEILPKVLEDLIKKEEENKEVKNETK